MSAPAYLPPEEELDAVSGGAPVPPPEPAAAAVVPPGTVAAAAPAVPVVTPPLEAAVPVLGPPPAPPALTGDPSADVQQNVLYQRQLTDWHNQATRHQAEANKRTATVQVGQADRELAAETAAQKTRQAEVERYQQERTQRQQMIDAAVRERQEAHKDLEHKDPVSGGQTIALIAGAIGAALQNYGAAQQGHVGNAQNEALNAINRIQATNYQKRKERLASASAGLMEARYGFKDAADNHRAALNDLDADQAAKYRLIAKEAAAQLARAGAGKEDIAANLLVADALRKSATFEAQIHDREEGHQTQREHNKATEAMANAHLRLQREQINATRGARDDARADRDEARGDKRAAAAEKKVADEKARTLYSPKTGEPLGTAPTVERAKVAGKEMESFENVRGDVAALREHVKKEGAVAPMGLTEASRTRETLAKSLVVRLSAFNQLGAISSDDRVILEGIAAGGVPAFMGTNVKQLDKVLTAVDRAEANALRGQGIQPPAKTEAPKFTDDEIARSYKALDNPNASVKEKKAANTILHAAGKI